MSIATDNDLLERLDDQSLCLVQGFPKGSVCLSLRNALQQAHTFSREGGPPISIKILDNEIAIPVEQIYRLWQRLRLA